MPTFVHCGRTLEYRVHGEGDRLVVLLHGLLLSGRMHVPLAEALAERGNRVVSLDLLGHGRSERPVGMAHYSMQLFAEQTVGLLDHLDAPEAVVLGTSLGANVTLEVAALAPGRLRGMVLEMPVLDGAMIACGAAFLPLLLGLRYGTPAMKLLQLATRAIPRGELPFLLDIALDTVRQDPQPSASVLEGLFFGRIAPPRTERRTMRTSALILGHRRDPIHPFSDAGMLADELPNSTLIEASSILELRVAPERLTGEIAAFLDACWDRRRVAGRRSHAAAG